MALEPVVNASATDEAFLFLLTITDSSGDVLRVVNNNEEVISRGNTFIAYPFSIILANDDGNTLPVLQLTIDNVDQMIVEGIRESLQPPMFLLELVLSSDPDTVEKSISQLRLGNIKYDALSVTGILTPMNTLTRRFPAESYTPVNYPGLFY